MKDVNDHIRWESEEDKILRDVNEEKRYWAVNITLAVSFVLLTFQAILKFI